jgi:uncharacterized protein (TIGR03083 family)
MRLAPRYDGPPVLSIDDDPTSQLVPTARQRTRLQTMLATLSAEQWQQASRCNDWSVRDVIAHLVTVNSFWHASVTAGCAGEPTRMLAGFDPAATPPKLVDTMHALSSAEVLEQFTATNEKLLAALDALTEEQWTMPAESPAGHVPIRLVAQHALWDCWVHERDVMAPLGLTAAAEPDELASCLQYAAAVGPLMGLGVGCASSGMLAVEATDPAVQFVLAVGDVVTLHIGGRDEHLPCLRGDAAELIDVLSLRCAPSADVPFAWISLLEGLQAAFDA